jgi:hypothetical protein
MSEALIAGLFAILVASITWGINEYERRETENYIRREKRYQRLVKLLRGFYEGGADARQREAFLVELNLCWLYCPDVVIRRGYVLMDSVSTGSTSSSEQRHLAAGDMLDAIRRDLRGSTLVPFWKRTSLKGADFRHYGVQPVSSDVRMG